MARWSLSNIFRTVTHRQFHDYTRQFKRAAEHQFGTECRLEIRALTAPKAYTTYLDDDIQAGLDEINDHNTILRTEDLDDVTPELWEQAGYVEVSVRPVDKESAPNYAFGHAEFKGEAPRQATFYIQPDGERVKQHMLRKSNWKITGDGFSSNGSRSWRVPKSLAGLGKFGL